MSRTFVRAAVVVTMAVAAILADVPPALATDPVVWRTTLRAPWELAADADGVVVIDQRLGVRGLDRDGHEQWTALVDGMLPAAPALGGGVVLVGTERGVTALARGDGMLRWQRPMSEATYAVSVAGDVALAGDRGGTLTAFTVATGEIRWSVRFGGSFWSGPRVDRATGAVVASWHETGEPAVRAFDLATGALRWHAPTGPCSAAPVVDDGLVVLAVGDCRRHAWVEARDLATGARRWQTPVPASFEEAIEPAIDARGVVVVDHFGVVTMLDSTTGQRRWQHDLAEPILGTRVTLTRRRVSFASFSGDVFVLDRARGRLVARLGRQRLGGYVASTLRAPWRGPDRLLIALRLRTWAVQLHRLP